MRYGFYTKKCKCTDIGSIKHCVFVIITQIKKVLLTGTQDKTYSPRAIVLCELSHPDTLQQRLARCLRYEVFIICLDGNEHTGSLSPVGEFPHQQVLGFALICHVTFTKHSHCQIGPFTENQFKLYLLYSHWNIVYITLSNATLVGTDCCNSVLLWWGETRKKPSNIWPGDHKPSQMPMPGIKPRLHSGRGRSINNWVNQITN